MAASVLALHAAPAHATFAGANGRIAYSQDNGLGDQLFTANADGSDAKPLIDAENSFPGGLPDWSPDGTKILFDSDHASTEGPPGPGFHIDIYAVDAKGGIPRRLTFSGINQKASWSPDGRRIAFERSDADCTPDHISIMNADGSHIRDLTTNPYGNCQTEEDASFSPDGRRIVFQRHRLAGDSQQSALFVMRSDGSDLHRITAWDSQSGQPDWSPDGRWILFNTSSDDFTPLRQIYVVHPDGERLTRLSEPTGTDVSFEASWSPNGRRILYVHIHFEPGDVTFGLQTMNVDGTGKVDLPGTARTGNPDWGPRPCDDHRRDREASSARASTDDGPCEHDRDDAR